MKKSPDFTISNAWICQIQQNAINPIFGDLIVHKGAIHSIQPKDFKKFVSQSMVESSDSLNANGRALTIPLVNFHEHIYSRLAKGLPIRGAMDNFQNILNNLWWKLDLALDAEMIEASAQMAALESIQNGVTYLFDHHASPNSTTGSLNIIKAALKNFGLRGILCFETSDRNSKAKADEALRENIHFIKESQTTDFKGMLGLHALFTLTDSTLQNAADLLKNLSTGIHIHLAESEDDPQHSKKRHGIGLAQRLKEFNLLIPFTILAHGNHLADEDYRIISDSGAAIVYNPDSNLNNAVGLAFYSNVPSQIPILAGTDGMSANIARALKQLFLLYRHQGASFEQAFQWLQKIYFDQIAFVLRYFPDFPSLQAGDRADFILWDYIPPTPFSAENFWGHFIYGMLERPVHTVVQNGKVLLQNRQLQIGDPDNLYKSIYAQGARLFSKM